MKRKVKRTNQSLLRRVFFWTETKRLRQKKQDIFQKEIENAENGKNNFKIMHGKTNLKAKNDETQ